MRAFSRAIDDQRSADAQTAFVTAAATLTPNQQTVHVTVPLLSADDYNITLPHSSECVGRFFSFYAVRASGSYNDGSVDIVSPTNDGSYTSSDGFETAGDRIVLMADEFGWFEILEACA